MNISKFRQLKFIGWFPELDQEQIVRNIHSYWDLWYLECDLPLERKGESDLLRGGSGGGIRDGGLGEHGEHVRNSTVRDPDLPAVHDPVLSVLAQLSPRLENHWSLLRNQGAAEKMEETGWFFFPNQLNIYKNTKKGSIVNFGM